MIDITPLATEKLSAYLSENNIDSAVRIAAINGCGGPSLGLALDECKEADHVLAASNITLVIDKGLSRTCGAVKVDYIEKGSGCSGGEGFSLTSARPLPRAGSGCGGSCASNGCGC